MKKFMIALLMIVTVGGISYLSFFLYEQNKPSKLESMGYTEDEIEIITSYLTEEQIKEIEQKNYDVIIPELLTNDAFQFPLLDRYLDYAKENEEVAPDEIILLVNHNIDELEIPYQKEIRSFISQDYFIEENLERYLNYQKSHTDKTYRDIVQEVNVHIDYPFYEYDIESDFSKGNLIIANKYYTLGADFVPDDLVTLTECTRANQQVTQETKEAYTNMCRAMKTEGLNLIATSTYRSYQTQVVLYNRYVSQHGREWADSCSSRAGHSEHQTGLTIDVITPTTDFSTFESTEEFAWLQEHAHEYGFILRYPEGKTYLTGYDYEPWHYRYVGVETATKIHELGITYDEYYEYFVK